MYALSHVMPCTVLVCGLWSAPVSLTYPSSDMIIHHMMSNAIGMLAYTCVCATRPYPPCPPYNSQIGVYYMGWTDV